LPAASIARTWNVWEPSESAEYVFGELHAAKLAPSSEHSKVTPAGGFDENVKVASALPTLPDGPESIVVSAGVRSTCQA
jgi:hypothetical protein